MVQKIRQILLTQYIGAIFIAIVAAHCVQTLINSTLAVFWHLGEVWRTPAGIWGEPRYQGFNWPLEIYSFTDVLLNAVVTVGLVWWLYLAKGASHPPSAVEPGSLSPQTAKNDA